MLAWDATLGETILRSPWDGSNHQITSHLFEYWGQHGVGHAHEFTEVTERPMHRAAFDRLRRVAVRGVSHRRERGSTVDPRNGPRSEPEASA